MIDSMYKLVRKMFPSKAYSRLQNTIGRKKTFFNYGHLCNIVDGYNKNISLEGKVILEFGQANDIGTGVLLLLQGAQKVYLVDKKNILTTHGQRDDRKYARQIINEYFKTNKLNQSEDFIDNIFSRIEFINAFLDSNIFDYLNNNSIDYIVCHQVLEHVIDLHNIFYCISRLLEKNVFFMGRLI